MKILKKVNSTYLTKNKYEMIYNVLKTYQKQYMNIHFFFCGQEYEYPYSRRHIMLEK